ncbi:MAG TPA: GntR family transcriptional regulator [Gaiellaceae bacterium]|nr:GntR family transcriptional regulator [Gaiellaceae bacterium]
MGTSATGRGKLTEEAYRHLRDAIMHGDLPTGSVLAESEIARALGSSRTPVRHALGQLLQEGLLEVGPRRQVIVRGFTPEHRAEILMLREALETVAVRRACEVMTLEDVDYLRLLLIRQRRAAREGSNETFLDLDEELHLRIAEGAQLPLLHGFLGQLRGFVRVARVGSPRPPEVLAQIVEEHEQLVDALEQRDVERALSVLVRHLHRHDYPSKRRQPARAAR